MPAIDLSQLPAPQIIDQLDYEAVLAAMLADLAARYPAITPALALESELCVKLLEVCAYREITNRAEFNARAQGALLAYAKGANLDAVALNLAAVREPGESDAAFLARALLAPDGVSTAGPEKSYIYHALSADPSITDVAVSSPTAGQVRVAILTNAPDGSASAPVLAAVTAALTADTVRPLTDQVVVVSATTAAFAITAQLLIGSGPDSTTVVAAATAAVNAYAAGQRRLGRKIARNAVIGALMQPGVDDLVLTDPAADIEPAPETAPILTSLTLTITTDSAGG